MTYDGTNRVYYVNGAFDGFGNAPPVTPDSSGAAIGNFINPHSSSFEGSIDELSVYRRALTSNEIAAIYQAGSNRKCAPALLEIISQLRIQ